MILVDTNVVSETMRRLPDVKVVAWLNSQASATLHLSAISLAELVLGIAVMPNGRRKTELGLKLANFGCRLIAEHAIRRAEFANRDGEGESQIDQCLLQDSDRFTGLTPV